MQRVEGLQLPCLVSSWNVLKLFCWVTLPRLLIWESVFKYCNITVQCACQAYKTTNTALLIIILHKILWFQAKFLVKMLLKISFFKHMIITWGKKDVAQNLVALFPLSAKNRINLFDFLPLAIFCFEFLCHQKKIAKFLAEYRTSRSLFCKNSSKSLVWCHESSKRRVANGTELKRVKSIFANKGK